MDKDKSLLISDGVCKKLKYSLKLFSLWLKIELKDAWSVDHESTQVDIFSYNMESGHTKCGWNLSQDCHKNIESGIIFSKNY